jgi:hypothetical protein
MIGVTIPGANNDLMKIGAIIIGERSVQTKIGDSARFTKNKQRPIMRQIEGMLVGQNRPTEQTTI